MENVLDLERQVLLRSEALCADMRGSCAEAQRSVEGAAAEVVGPD